ncbi:uncharacterized protein EI90DRAFT_3042993 [Cantharellus anzutake]|uniref:uncharacterized protein n=1 Tax=Cantharellus anzutake TaxID=1750568 RepID=UPI00190824F0|nr:uncharacterized protein EI90DRAFT_3042993 [Cantharellus anzutake]KAF8337441.1 hypothetical protein EI90DRAFT_3042993 [Cantharellus anzutake]
MYCGLRSARSVFSLSSFPLSSGSCDGFLDFARLTSFEGQGPYVATQFQICSYSPDWNEHCDCWFMMPSYSDFRTYKCPECPPPLPETLHTPE